ncbi:sensor histidine kinase [Phytoactinopolyspora halotolerans]|uniref:histidine kinase n=1 Tax=Phytoactinopolyspora halotolerans TaxID=1981512 RepID=A0A6L9SD17_9ACTN|nr:sensor histidine kinase [Phytoactinopolyspora halotolerans]NEE02977.1 sensor histidine kinase [Phytoactinopolyspora halotolerans]
MSPAALDARLHAGFPARPVPWISPVLYGVVVVAGAFAGVTGLGDTRYVPFVTGLTLLMALDVAERRRYPAMTPTVPAITLLVARLVLFVAVAAADGSGLSRVLFLLLPFTAYFAFGWKVSIALGLVSLGLLVIGFELTVPQWYGEVEQVSDLLMFVVGLALTIAMASVAVEEQRGRARLEQSHAQLRTYASRVSELSAAAERSRVSRDIHDGLGHHLTAITLLLEKATTFLDLDRAAARQALDDASRSARRALEDVRHSVRTLRASTEPFHLSAALNDLVREADGGELSVSLDFSGDESRCDPAALITLYRAAQEGITNARRHAHASHVWVTASCDDENAHLVVADDGCGFPPEREGYGLLGMRERAQLVGGSVEVVSGPDAGTQVIVTIPHKVAV